MTAVAEEQEQYVAPSFRAQGGGCEAGGGTCPNRPELEVTVPAVGACRRLCHHDAGAYMLAAATNTRVTLVRVRLLAP